MPGKRIKILRIIARLNIGGPAIHTVLLSDGLDKEKFHTILACGYPDKNEGDMSYYAAQKDVLPYFIPELKRELNLRQDFAAFKKIYGLIKKEHPDIIHTHTAKAGALGRLAGILYNLTAARNKKAKLIHTFHGHIFGGYFGKIKARFFILIEKLLALFSYRIIIVSQRLKQELISLGIGGDKKIAVIPLGFELEGILNMPPRSDNTINAGIVGRLVPVKNHIFFLEAARKVIDDNPGLAIKFKIIGDGELRQKLQDYAKNLALNSHIEFLGWQKDLVSIYSGIDIVALTSLNEGTPVSLIEAMASARAVIATDVGGVRDLLGEDAERGILVKPQDFSAFTDALNRLIKDNDLRREIGLRAREFVRERFTKERLIKDIENLYLGVV